MSKQHVCFMKKSLNYSPFIFKAKYVFNTKKEDRVIEDCLTC